jgi:hypothetical protein
VNHFVARALVLSCLFFLGIGSKSGAASLSAQAGQNHVGLAAQTVADNRHPLAGSQFQVGSWSGAAFVAAEGEFDACYVLHPAIDGVVINFVVGRDPAKLVIQLFDRSWNLPKSKLLEADLSLDNGPAHIVKGQSDNPNSILFAFKPASMMVRALSNVRVMQFSTSKAVWRFPMDEAKQALLTLYSCVAAHGPQGAAPSGASGASSASPHGSDPFDPASK